jgi:hypothetical protein
MPRAAAGSSSINTANSSPTEPCDGVSGADAVLDPVGDCAQQVVTCGVAKAVVDQFEVVEVQ